jgi:GNAT superfamily N-acetyltransferase
VENVPLTRGEYSITTDKSALDVALVHRTLSRETYWAQGRSLPEVRTSIEHSLCFGLFHREQQVGFARAVTDRATFAWICDVFVLEPHRGRGLGKWLIETVMAHPHVAAAGRALLATRDAHDLYRRYGGFAPLAHPERWMEREG